MNRKHSQSQQICDTKDEQIKQLEVGVQKILQEKAEMSVVVAQKQEELTATKQQLTSCQGIVEKLSDTKAKQVNLLTVLEILWREILLFFCGVLVFLLCIIV